MSSFPETLLCVENLVVPRSSRDKKFAGSKPVEVDRFFLDEEF